MNIKDIFITGLFMTVMVFGAFTFAPQAFALGTGGCTSDCGSSGSTIGGGVSEPNGTSGGNPPSCDVITNKIFVNAGQQYTISWNNTGSGTFKLGGQVVEPTGFITYTWDANNVFLVFTVTGENAYGTCSDRVTVYQNTVAPTCDLTTDLNVVNDGQQFRLTWNGTPTTNTVFRLQGKIVAASDSQLITWPAGRTTPITVTFTGKNARGTCTKSVTVYPASNPPALPTCVLTATPTTIVAGATTRLTWTSAHAVSGSIDHGVNTIVLTNTAGRAVTPAASVLYTMTVTNSAGVTGHCTATVHVTTVVPPPTCVLTATPATINAGGTSKLTWTATNATGTATISDIAGTVLPNNTNGFRNVSPSATKTYTMTVHNVAGVTGHCTATVHVTTVVPPPTCTLTATPTSIILGSHSRLTWTYSSDATSGSIDQGINTIVLTNTAGRVITPTASKLYTMTVRNAAGHTGTCTAQVTVNTPAVPACDLNSSKTQVTAGGTARLTWTVSNAVGTSTINPGGYVVVANNVDGYRDVVVNATTTYTMTVHNVAGVTRTCTVTIRVVPPPTPNAPVCNSFTAAPTTINRGQSSTLTWTTTRATRVSIDHAVGTNLQADGSTSVSPLVTTTYHLSAINSAGTDNSCVVTVTVRQQPTTFTCENNVSFTADDTSITRGDSTVLHWSVTGAATVAIDHGVSASAKSGSQSVSPTDTTTYTLTATKPGFTPLSCPLKIDVNSSHHSHSGSVIPRCDTFNLSDNTVLAGESTILTWKTSNASDLTIKDAAGTTLVTTENKTSSDKNDLLDGTMTLRPTQSTTYTLTATRGSRDKVCTVAVVVGGATPGVTILENRDQLPLVSGISLTQVPYTGFDAGPFLTMVFYGLLVLWALYLAYVLVIRRNSIGGVALAGVPSTPVMPTLSANVNQAIFTTPTASPRFVATPTPVVTPTVVPTATTPVVGYGAITERNATYDDAATAVENQAHAERVLLSSEAMFQFVTGTTEANRTASLAEVIAKAKATYPTEDGWVVITAERMKALFTVVGSVAAVDVAPATPSPFTPASVVAGNSSLAEAIMTGNIVAAYQLIGHRPMIALADAAAELDTVYRIKQGATATVSNLLATESAKISPEKLQAAISALTGALDGTYTDEAEAVKMAILKAVKAIN